MMHYSVFSQTQPVKWLKIHRRRRKKSKWPVFYMCNGSSNTVMYYFIFFEWVSVLVRMHLLYNVGQAYFFEHEWGLLLVLCAYGVYRVRVVVLGAWQHAMWAPNTAFIKSLLLGVRWPVNEHSIAAAANIFFKRITLHLYRECELWTHTRDSPLEMASDKIGQMSASEGLFIFGL